MTEYGRGVTEGEINSLPPGILDKFNYVYGICIAPEIDFFSLDGFDNRGWWYIVGKLGTKQIRQVYRQARGTDYLSMSSGITTLTDAIRKGFSSRDIAIAVLTSPNFGRTLRKAA